MPRRRKNSSVFPIDYFRLSLDIWENRKITFFMRRLDPKLYKKKSLVVIVRLAQVIPAEKLFTDTKN